MKRVTFILLSFFIAFSSFAQKKEDILENLNQQILFINDGIHGVVLAHIIFENYNQNLNKYVDLEADSINSIITNSLIEIPDLFDDISSFGKYGITPKKRYNKLLADPYTFSSVKSYLKKEMNILNALNKKRFTIETYLNKNDLKDRSNVYGAYELLEECVTLFDEYYLTIQKHYEEIRKIYDSQNYQLGEHEKLYVRLAKLHRANKDILDALRAKSDFGFESLLDKMVNEVSKLKSFIANATNSTYKRLEKTPLFYEKIDDAIEFSISFYNTAEVPADRKQYGKFYHYYNDKLLYCFNYTSAGYVCEMNDMRDRLNIDGLYFVETPRYFKVIYPKVLDTVNHIASSDDRVDFIPKMLKDREIKESAYKIQVTEQEFVVQFYDHKIQDGDIVSINFNGDWVLEKKSIESKPIELKLLLNEQGKNYLLLHAVNEGRRPPNTLAIRYRVGEEKKEITLSSTLNTSEMIEIEYVKPQEDKN